MKNIILILLAVCMFACTAEQKNAEPALIPYPADLQMRKGEFQLNSKTPLVINDQGQFSSEIEYLQSLMTTAVGNVLPVETGSSGIIINLDESITNPEAYKLDVTSKNITISAGNPAGCFLALQTLRQLLPVEIESGKTQSAISIPALSISDAPAFGWRGMHLDVSRHFYTLEYLKKHIDRLSLYKFNKFHFHLTDDQGWRIEIKKYPELTSKGAWRTFNQHDSACIKKSAENPDFIIDPRFIKEENGKQVYGGFYTQEEIKDLIKYAEARHVEIIPEIDMPGHMFAATSVYPNLTATGKIGWGDLFSVPLCPCNDEVYVFVEDVLSEIIDLFPSNYIHIGADEVDKSTWAASARCKELMKKEGLENVNQLQSYFVHRVQQFLTSKGKKTIGWDEVLEGGINSDMTIMYWRGWVKDAPLKAVQNGNNVIMTPTNPLYFDYLPNKGTLHNVYHMQVIPKGVSEQQASQILGAQANLWAEMIPSEKRAEFLMYPRMTALAERVWTNKDLYESYCDRLLSHFLRWDQLGINYRLPDIQGFAQESVFTDKVMLDIKSPLDNMKIHYTMDGTLPSTESPILSNAIAIDKPVQVKFALFSPGGAKSEIYTINYRQVEMGKPITTPLPDLQPGLQCDFFDGYFAGTKKIKPEPDKQFIVKNITFIPEEAQTKSFALRYTGYIDIPETGIYSFFFTCDDGGVLYIDDQQVIDNDGLHAPLEKSGQAALEKGLHPIRLDFVEGGGGYTLLLQYSLNGSTPADLPDNWFSH